jgi:hypothetical protein
MSRWRRRPERCRDWPYCGCGDKWQHWTAFAKYDDGSPLTEEQLREVHTDLVFMLSCVSQYCPDPEKRRHAQLQLMRPIFSREARKWIQ